MTLTVTECTSEVSNGNVYPLEVTIPGFDRFTIYIEGECSCECDNSIEIDPVKCVNGELRCDRCYCYNGWQQDICDCPIKPCPMFNGLECGGRGTCDGCGSCLCNKIGSQNGVTNPKIFGDACQCSNFECEANSDGVVDEVSANVIMEYTQVTVAIHQRLESHMVETFVSVLLIIVLTLTIQ